MKDMIFEVDHEQLIPSTQLTASKTDVPVVDLAAFGINDGPINSLYFLVSVDAIGTADGSNLFTFKLFHSDLKASDTALTDGVEVTATTGLLNEASPVINATTLTTQAQKQILIGYRGTKAFVQIQPTETGAADVTVSLLAVGGVLDSSHGDKLA